MISYQPLSDFLTEYTLRNDNNRYKPVAVGRYGIRTRDSIYTKELAKDYSNNKVIYQNTLTVGMGSVQIDIGILTEDIRYSVSPAYHTYQIRNINPAYLRYCLECRNQDMFTRFVKRGSRQGKSIDLKRWLTYEIPVFDERIQTEIVAVLDRIKTQVENRHEQLELFEQLVKSRFIELFGDPVYNTKKLPTKRLAELGSLDRGRSQHRPRNAPELLGGPHPLIQTGEVANAGLYITGYSNTYSELGLKQSKKWKAGTLCITIAANIAQTSILTFDACFPDSVVGFIPGDSISAIYMHYWFGFFQKILEEQAPQVAQKNINLKILSDLSVVVPNQEQQKDFIAFVEQTDKSKYFIHSTIENYLLINQSSWREKHDYN